MSSMIMIQNTFKHVRLGGLFKIDAAKTLMV